MRLCIYLFVYLFIYLSAQADDDVATDFSQFLGLASASVLVVDDAYAEVVPEHKVDGPAVAADWRTVFAQRTPGRLQQRLFTHGSLLLALSQHPFGRGRRPPLPCSLHQLTLLPPRPRLDQRCRQAEAAGGLRRAVTEGKEHRRQLIG